MFTGIITAIGQVAQISQAPGADRRVAIETGQDMSGVAIGASIACSGVCLTVTTTSTAGFTVDVSAETIARTAPAMWEEGSALNLERSLKVGDELGGHIVTGHVDGLGTIEAADPTDGSLHLTVRAPATLAAMIAAKGSISIDGVSLTVNHLDDAQDGSSLIHLNIIPHTAQWTTLGTAYPGRQVNLEIDVLARYLARMQQVHTA